jgi:hypothetical protein
VDVLYLMDCVQRQQNFSCVELGLLVGENVFFHEQVHQVSSGEVLHDEVEVVCILEGTFEADHPMVVSRVGKHVSLLSRLHDLVLKDHFALLQFLHCHRLSRFGPLTESDLPEGSLTDYF